MDRLAFAPRCHGGSPRSGSIATFEIASDLGTAEDLVDGGGVVERRVEAEAQVGHEFEIEPWGEELAKMAAVTLEGGEEGILASGYERAYVNGGKLRSAESCTSTMVTPAWSMRSSATSPWVKMAASQPSARRP